MHFVFIPYGPRHEVEYLLRLMEAENFEMTLYKGRQQKSYWVKGAIREAPFGVKEYIFPKERLDTVLTTLNADSCHSSVPRSILLILRKMVKCQKVPDFKKSERFIWRTQMTQNVAIIPIGIREDKELTEDKGEFKGWTHEAL